MRILTKKTDILGSKLASFISIAGGARVSAAWALQETENILSRARAEGENIRVQMYNTAVMQANDIRNSAQDEAEQIRASAHIEADEILAVADERTAVANSINDAAVAFKQQMEMEAAEIKAAADTKAAQAAQMFADFLSQFKEKVSNLSLETAVDTGVLDLSQGK